MNAWAGEDLETINANIDMTKVLIEHIYLMLEFLYMENHGFMDDFKQVDFLHLRFKTII